MPTIKQDYTGIGPRLPLAYDKKHGPYALIADPKEEIKQNLIHLLLTSPGERVMDSNFGVGIRSFLFENFTFDTKSEIEERVRNQVSKYLSSVSIVSIRTAFDETKNLLYIRLEFFIPALGVTDTLDLNIEDTNVSL
tara:strand:+ start:489 stop:899 length:411 start_codon:yes stop_codon:yes gene_type:complete